jgi:DNA (cytosine-5)-methyltransferase 1
MRPTHFSLFTGIGGIDLASEWAGFETVGQCEIDDYCNKVLEKHWPDVPRWRDIRDVTAESVREAGIESVTLVSGGFPCQPFSVAGKRRGKADDRFLWPEMLRVISELRPTWVLGENVAGIISMALDQVLSDLENQGYETITFNIPACGVNAPHRRYRVFIVARNTNGLNWNSGEISRMASRQGADPTGVREDVAHTDLRRCKKRYSTERGLSVIDQDRRWPTESRLGGMVDGVSSWLDEPRDIPRVATVIKDRVNRLRCLGNAVVPQQVYPILRAIAWLEGDA